MIFFCKKNIFLYIFIFIYLIMFENIYDFFEPDQNSIIP